MSGFLVVHTDWHQHPLYPDQQEAFEQMGIEVLPLVTRTQEEFLEVAGRADAILNSDFCIGRELLLALRRCRVISRYGSGLNNIDVKTATSLGIPVANVPEFCTDAVADRTFVLLLACSGNLLFLDRYVRDGKWGLKGLPFALELRGKTLGLVGFGRIGRAVADRATGFGLNVMACDPYVNDDYMQSRGVRPTDLETLLRNSDFVSLHIPLTEETHHLLSESRIALMKPSCIFINTARGGVVDEQALVQALGEGALRAAGLDVFEEEPPPANHPLFALGNVVLTPHCGAHTQEATERVRRAAVAAVVATLGNERPENLVNPETWGKGPYPSPLDGLPLPK